MVEGATLRKVATSRVVHQSRGSASVTPLRLQRLRCLIPASALGRRVYVVVARLREFIKTEAEAA